MSRYLTKSRFKLALECPTKLFYAGKTQYANQKLNDPFLAQLADGGFQVGALAKLYFPGGVEVSTLDHDSAFAETEELLARDEVIIFEAAFRYKNFFIRADVIEKNGNNIDLIEVKAKSCDFEAENGCWDKRKGTILEKWVPYVADVAFQKWVIERATDHRYVVTPHLMLADKTSLAPTDRLNQKFRLAKTNEGRRCVDVSTEITDEDLSVPLLRKIRMTDSCNQISEHKGFEEDLYRWADAYAADSKLPPVPYSGCKTCEFRADLDDIAVGLRCGYRECWREAFGWSEEDFEGHNVLDIWNFKRKDNLIADGKLKLHQIDAADIAPKTRSKAEAKTGLDLFRRQWLQICKARDEDDRPHFDAENLAIEMKEWEYPLHFIDFETAMPVIPFNQGRRPYGQIAFQFSHHTVDRDGNVTHSGQHLDTRTGVFPNYDFVRALKASLENDRGTIFRYHSHENSYLAEIRSQLLRDEEWITDREVLVAFIESIAKPRGQRDHPEDDWEAGPRNMVDLFDLVKRFYYHPHSRGSISIKYILPAVLRSSDFLREKYSQPVYGAAAGIPSLNFIDKVWYVPDGSGHPINPYKLLPPLFSDESEHDSTAIVSAYFDEYIRDGGAATTAYAKLQFEDIPSQIRYAVEAALLQYCELDTLAMVMIYEAWMADL